MRRQFLALVFAVVTTVFFMALPASAHVYNRDINKCKNEWLTSHNVSEDDARLMHVGDPKGSPVISSATPTVWQYCRATLESRETSVGPLVAATTSNTSTATQPSFTQDASIAPDSRQREPSALQSPTPRVVTAQKTLSAPVSADTSSSQHTNWWTQNGDSIGRIFSDYVGPGIMTTVVAVPLLFMLLLAFLFWRFLREPIPERTYASIGTTVPYTPFEQSWRLYGDDEEEVPQRTLPRFSQNADEE